MSRIKTRARIYQQIRAFFNGRGFIEVDTPLLAGATNTDAHIQSVVCRVNQREAYLQTSPEFAMKRLLSEGSGSIFQICHAFRDEEQGARHCPEFTLLEWYSVGFDYRQLMDQVGELLEILTGSEVVVERLSYRQAFQQCLGFDPLTAELDQIRAQVAQSVATIDPQTLSRDDCLDLLMGTTVCHGFKGWTLVYDYPASQAALARLKSDDPRVAERFELFYRDMELANGFSELTDAEEQRSRFERDNVNRLTAGLAEYPVDEQFLAALEAGMPNCAGVAVGIERLLMVLSNTSDIRQVQTLKDQN